MTRLAFCAHKDHIEVCIENLQNSYQSAKAQLDVQLEFLDIKYLHSCLIAKGSLGPPETASVYKHDSYKAGGPGLSMDSRARVWRLNASLVIDAYGQLYKSYSSDVWQIYNPRHTEEFQHIINLIQQRLEAS